MYCSFIWFYDKSTFSAKCKFIFSQLTITQNCIYRNLTTTLLTSSGIFHKIHANYKFIQAFDFSDLIVIQCNESISRNPIKFLYSRIIDVKSIQLVDSSILYLRVTILEFWNISTWKYLFHRDYNFEENSNNKIILSR